MAADVGQRLLGDAVDVDAAGTGQAVVARQALLEHGGQQFALSGGGLELAVAQLDHDVDGGLFALGQLAADLVFELLHGQLFARQACPDSRASMRAVLNCEKVR